MNKRKKWHETLLEFFYKIFKEKKTEFQHEGSPISQTDIPKCEEIHQIIEFCCLVSLNKALKGKVKKLVQSLEKIDFSDPINQQNRVWRRKIYYFSKVDVLKNNWHHYKILIQL